MTIFNTPVLTELIRGLAKMLLALLGWKAIGSIPNERPLIAIIAPHTSNWDFVFLFTVALTLRINVNFIGKNTLFKGPFGPILRWAGGIPVDRSAPGDIIEQAADAIRGSDDMIMAMSPEGTRSRVERWKTGFYRMATAADVPILMAGIDYPDREVTLLELFRPTGDMDADMDAIQLELQRFRGKYPEKQT